MGRARGALPRILSGRPARTQHLREPLPSLGALAGDDAARPPSQGYAGGPGLGIDDRERLRSDGSLRGRRLGPVAADARDREDLRSGQRPLARPAPQRDALDGGGGGSARRPAPALRGLGARARRLQHGLLRARLRPAAVQHERLLVARPDRRGPPVGDEPVRAEGLRGRGRRAQRRRVRLRRCRRRSARRDRRGHRGARHAARARRASGGLHPQGHRDAQPRASRRPHAAGGGGGPPGWDRVSGERPRGQGPARSRRGSFDSAGTSRRSIATSSASARRWSRSPRPTRPRRRSSSS